MSFLFITTGLVLCKMVSSLDNAVINVAFSIDGVLSDFGVHTPTNE